MADLINIIDGDFTIPREVEGSGVFYIDEITRAKILTRKYCVERALFQPLLTDDLAPVKDYQYPSCILVEERPDSAPGRLLFFTRTFAEVPASRTETRTVAFTQPGLSQALFSDYSKLAIWWNQYGGSQPYTRNAVATVAYSYKTDPTTFVVPDISRITYRGAPVDYAGDVYVYVGNRVVVTGPITGLSTADGQIIVEPKWLLQGSTVPRTLPANWILDTQINRWRGTIWEMAVITVPTIKAA
ncbi:MAG: hypothetical protein JSR30_00055 [Proteobacteria bacterium]|nr:hypothetical protein [Pseudomonadota bacterium]